MTRVIAGNSPRSDRGAADAFVRKSAAAIRAAGGRIRPPKRHRLFTINRHAQAGIVLTK
jgi:hypothetical protein